MARYSTLFPDKIFSYEVIFSSFTSFELEVPHSVLLLRTHWSPLFQQSAPEKFMQYYHDTTTLSISCYLFYKTLFRVISCYVPLLCSFSPVSTPKPASPSVPTSLQANNQIILLYVRIIWGNSFQIQVQKRLLEFMLAAFHRSPHFIALLKVIYHKFSF